MSAIETRQKLSLGRVFGDTFAVLQRQWALLFAISIVLIFIPSLIASALNMRALGASPGAAFAILKSPLYAPTLIVSLLLGLFALCCQIHIAVSDLDGRAPELTEVLGAAARKTLPMLLLTMLVYIAATLGLMVFFVPGLILFIIWSVSLPAGVAETSNPLRAMGRSRELTRGNRWRIFGLMVIAWFLFFAAGVLLIGLRGGLAAATHAPDFGQLVLSTIISLLASVITGVGSAALYVQLRNLKAGTGGEALAQVFA